jgi:rubrerythrin
VLEDGKRFKSPSSAASAVMGGSAANGWRFWSLEGDAPAAASTPAKTEAPKNTKPKKLIYRLPNQQGAPEGQTKFFCNACQKSFLAEGKEAPEQCPEGHGADDPELTVPVSTETQLE